MRETYQYSSNIPFPKRAQYRRYKTPTVIQMEVTECGAAALCIILGYYGSYVSLEEARMMCSVTRDGSNALNMLKAAQYYGLEGEGLSIELKELYETQLPLIAFWRFDHFVVIEGFSKQYVYINDPSHGPRQITYQELNESFTGVVLTFKPTELLKKKAAPRKKWISLLLRLLKLFWPPILFSLFIGLLAIIPQLGLAALSQVFIDNILISKMENWKWGILLGLALVSILAFGINYLQSWIYSRFTIKLCTVLSTQFAWHLLRLPILFFSQRYGGEVASRMGLIEMIADTVVQDVLSTITSITFALIIVVIMFFYDITITIIAISVVLFSLILMKLLYRFREDAYANYKQVQGKMTSFAINGLDSIESLKASGGEYQFISRYGGIYANSLNILQSITFADIIIGTISPFIYMAGSLSILFLGTVRIIQSDLTIGELFALQILFNQFTAPTLYLMNINQTLQLLQINITRIDDILCHPEDKSFKEGSILKSQKKESLQSYVEAKNISFSFSPLQPPVIEGISVALPPSSIVALVGPSGCGKSTLVKVIAGLFQATSGEMFLDEVPYSHYPKEVINRFIALIEQFSYLFEDSVQMNLSMMDPFADQNALIQASKDACIHEEIITRPGGYQSLIEKQGANFSGGQRQRLEIACALFRHPPILILDEATSALDSLTEKQVLENLRKRGFTCLIVTHRLSTIQNCDNILVMDKGKIVQEGRHEELIQQIGIYQSLVYANHFNQLQEA